LVLLHLTLSEDIQTLIKNPIIGAGRACSQKNRLPRMQLWISPVKIEDCLLRLYQEANEHKPRHMKGKSGRMDAVLGQARTPLQQPQGICCYEIPYVHEMQTHAMTLTPAQLPNKTS
jgi:hypothetical protein